ncbi:hypothetical protein QEZ54_14655 [Catellatospora sp. KI3]|uniref:hypothetical protein n=1 Tax=Catellatospora sp. KI3 TaxID=3041620 RepID=UPI002482B9FB|nr:hypothetical protein [Catellatospora sp. KI3]MDI1462207.1 hypothetical protein [Catellatospora sp. KI3]
MTENPAPPRRSGSILFGLLALIPAVVLLCTGYLIPTVRTVLASFTNASLMGGPGESVGMKNFEKLLPRFAESLVGPLLLATAVTGTALVCGGALAWLAARAGRPGRWTLRLAFALPVAAVGGTVAAVSWQLAFEDAAPNAYLAQFAAFAGLAVGLGATGYLLVFRRSTRLGATWPGALLVTGVIMATSTAYALQSFSFPLLLVAPNGPRGRTPTVLIFDAAFRSVQLGQASAGAVLLWLLLAVLGIGVAVWLILSRARIEPAEQPEPAVPGDRSTWAAVSLVATGVAALIGLAGLLPLLLQSLSLSTKTIESNLLGHLVNTWVPPLISTILGVSAAALAGYGIGALRPLGRYSGLLLLPFAPWLFTGLPALTPDAFAHRGDDGEFLALIPPASLCVPVLFGSALLFRGVRWTRALPVLALSGLMVWVVAAQDAWWQLIVALEPSTMPMPVLLLQVVNRFGGEDAPVGWTYPLPALLLVAAAVAVVQVLFMDRLTLRTGKTGATLPLAP